MWDREMAGRLGAVLRQLRIDRGVSQDELARISGITKSQIQLIEGGRASTRRETDGPSNPGLATMYALAGALGVNVSDVLRDADL